MSTIYYQGIAGAFQHQAATEYFGENYKNSFVGLPQFEDVFRTIALKKTDIYGVTPIENSLAGSVLPNYQLFLKYDVMVCAEIYLLIDHYLMGLAKNVREVTDVFAHQMALLQCENFFAKHPFIKKHEYDNNATAAKMVANSNNPKFACIAGKVCGQIYDLPIIQAHIQDNSNNWTRFFVLTNSKNGLKTILADTSKVSISFCLKHESGSLNKVLDIIAKNKANLTKIESRPIHDKPFEYRFFIDFEISNHVHLNSLLSQISKQSSSLKLLGVYKPAKFV